MKSANYAGFFLMDYSELGLGKKLNKVTHKEVTHPTEFEMVVEEREGFDPVVYINTSTKKHYLMLRLYVRSHFNEGEYQIVWNQCPDKIK